MRWLLVMSVCRAGVFGLAQSRSLVSGWRGSEAARDDPESLTLNVVETVKIALHNGITFPLAALCYPGGGKCRDGDELRQRIPKIATKF